MPAGAGSAASSWFPVYSTLLRAQVECREHSIFRHKGSCTLYLAPSCEHLHNLQAELAACFPACADQARGFTPHLSVGQYKTAADAEQAAEVSWLGSALFCFELIRIQPELCLDKLACALRRALCCNKPEAYAAAQGCGCRVTASALVKCSCSAGLEGARAAPQLPGGQPAAAVSSGDSCSCCIHCRLLVWSSRDSASNGQQNLCLLCITSLKLAG